MIVILTDSNLACKKCWYMEDAKKVFADSSVGNRQLFLLFRRWILCRCSKNLESSSVNNSNWDIKVKEKLIPTSHHPKKGEGGQWSFFLMGHVCRSTNLQANTQWKQRRFCSDVVIKHWLYRQAKWKMPQEKTYSIYHILNTAITWTLNFPATIAVSVPMSLPGLMWNVSSGPIMRMWNSL
jgi:hypothetical protein